MHILYVSNKRLPENDHRLIYPNYSTVCTLTYALPGKPDCVMQKNFFLIGFGEGLQIRDFLNFLKLFNYLRAKRKTFDFVHFNATLLILFGPMLAFITGVPSIITLTGFGRTFTNQQVKYRLIRPVYWFLLYISVYLSKVVLFQNRGDQETISQRFPASSNKFHYIGSAVHTTVVKNKDFYSPRLRVLLLARLLPDKGIDDYLRVAEHLQSEDMDFVLAGPESRGFSDLLVKVISYDAAGIIKYMGDLDTSNVERQFEQSHILFFPSSYGEGMSRVMLEAGFARVCPIAYDIPANLDLIDKGRGFLVEAKDTQHVEEILLKLASDRSLLEQNAREYQRYIISNYDIQSFARRMDQILLGLSPKTG